MKLMDRVAPTDGVAADLVEFEPVVVSAPPSIALEGIERYLRMRNNRLAIVAPHSGAPESPASVITCVVTMTVRAHPNNALVSRFHDRIELQWHAEDVSCPDLSGRLTIRPLSNKTELVFKGRCGPSRLGSDNEAVAFDASMARAVVRCVLEQFKYALEVEFEKFKDFIHASERETSRGGRLQI